MNKFIFVLFILCMYSCSNSSTENISSKDSSVIAPDTTLHPNGITNDAVISADTGAYKVKDADTMKNK